jgi:hypothetical protein
MGRISPTAMAIQADYLRFAAERGCPSSLRDLLTNGGRLWPTKLRQRFPSLARWHGVGHLKRRLGEIAGANKQATIMLASRSHSHMLLAAHLLCRNCATILTADLGWPRYHEILCDVARKLNRHVVQVSLRHLAENNCSEALIVDAVTKAFRVSGASGLFLPAISHDGVQLPLGHIAHSVRASNELRFFAVDGAQHLAHGNGRFTEMDCDFYVAGTHKWLRSLYPLGVAIYGLRRSKEMIETTVQELAKVGSIDDPLLKFTAQLENSELDGITETVNLSALLSAHGAALDAYPSRLRSKIMSIQLKNAECISTVAEDAGWRPIRRSSTLGSGILMLRPPISIFGQGEDLRDHLESHGVIATTYADGAVRFSMPRRSLEDARVNVIRLALHSVSGHLRPCEPREGLSQNCANIGGIAIREGRPRRQC